MNEKGPVREIDIVIEWIQNRSKIIWWAFLLILLSYYVWKNSNRILSENPITIDYFIVILLFLLLLLPLASEINFLGFSIKKEIESIKSEIKGEFVSLRSEIHNSISLQQVFHAAPQPLPDEKLKEINNEFLNHNRFTDVIAFDYSVGKSIKGEIYISIDSVKYNANNYKVSLIIEVVRVMIHGALHLCGYEDDSERMKKVMTEIENRWIGEYRKG